MSGPKQFVTVGGVRIATEDFVKNREAILERMKNGQPKQEPGQMMKKPIDVNIAQEKFEKELEIAKEEIEKEVETPVGIVEEIENSDTETTEPIQVPVEEKKTQNKRKTSWKKK